MPATRRTFNPAVKGLIGTAIQFSALIPPPDPKGAPVPGSSNVGRREPSEEAIPLSQAWERGQG